MQKFLNGQKVFIVENKIFVKEVTVIKYSGGFYLIRNEKSGGYKVREERLFKTKYEAECFIRKNK